MPIIPGKRKIPGGDLGIEPVVPVDDPHDHLESIGRTDAGKVQAEAHLEITGRIKGTEGTNFIEIYHDLNLLVRNNIIRIEKYIEFGLYLIPVTLGRGDPGEKTALAQKESP